MTTTKARINVSLADSACAALVRLAKRDNMPTATKAALLLETALELEEDEVWNTLAGQRDTKNARYLSHAKVWQNV